MSASAVVIHYEEALYQVYAPLPFTFTPQSIFVDGCELLLGHKKRYPVWKTLACSISA